MPFCSRCGASTTPQMAFCASCGESLTKASYPPGAPPPHLAPPPPASTYGATGPPRGPPGATREPAMVVILSIVTLGLYGLYYWWVASREMDAYAQRPGHSHNLVRIGTILSVVGVVLLIIAVAGFVGSVFASELAGGEPSEEEVLAAILGSIGMFVLFGLVSFAGSIVRLVGKYRLWEMLEADERQRGHPTPLSAGLMVALTVIGWFVSIIGSVLALIVMYMTQDHVNQAWGKREP